MSFAKYQEGAGAYCVTLLPAHSPRITVSSRTRGPDALSIAVQLDKDGKYEQAMKQYTRGAELMLEGAKVDDLAARKARMKERAREYIARAEQLKQSLQVSPCAPCAALVCLRSPPHVPLAADALVGACRHL